LPYLLFLLIFKSMMKTIKGLLFLFFALVSNFLAANELPKSSPPSMRALDSLVLWYKPFLAESRLNSKQSQGLIKPEIIVYYYSKINSDIEFEFNKEVLKYINLLTVEQKNNFEVSLALQQKYLPAIEKEISLMGLPDELKYLPVVLSGFHNYANYKEGAGIWKLNYYVGKKYNLAINEFIDERKSIEKSTHAALSYLKDLYSYYNNWELTIAAFVSSSAQVNKAIIQSKGQKNYYEILNFLDESSKAVIPSFFAAVYSSKYYDIHNLLIPEIEIDIAKEKILVKESIPIKEVSQWLKLSKQEIILINPTLRGNTIPSNDAYDFFLPSEFASKFNSIEDSLIANIKKKKEAEKAAVAKASAPAIPAGSSEVIHYVKSGEFLGSIAEKYHVSVSSIKYWNNLYSDRINIGQKLYIYSKGTVAKKPVTTAPKPVTQSTSHYNLTDYTVKEGDTLWGIAKDNPGNSIEIIQKVNNISTDIKPGQKIKIVKP